MALLSVGLFGARFVFSAEIKQYFGLRMYLSFAVILAAGFVIHDPLPFILIASAVMVASVSSRMDAVCRLAILTALIPNVYQFITIGGLYLTVITTPVVMSFAALVACYARKGSQQPRKFTAEDSLVILLLFCFGIAAARSGTFTVIERSVTTVAIELGLPYFVYRRFVHGRAEFGHVVAALAGAAMILSFLALCESRLHWALYDTIYSNQSLGGFMSRNTKLRGGFLRAPTSFSDSTAFAIFEMVGVFAVISSRRFFRSGPLWSGSIVLTILGLIAAQSRGADLGLIFGLVIVLAVRRRYALAGAIAGGAVAIVALLLVLASSSPMAAAFIGAEKHAGPDQDYRQTLLRRGLQVGMEHPILGDDITRIITKMSDIKQGEGIVDFVNSYLAIFLNSGLVGLGLVLVLIIVIFSKIFRVRDKYENKYSAGLQIFVASALGAELFALAFTPIIYERNAYWLMILLAGCRCFSLQEKMAKPNMREPILVVNNSSHIENYSTLHNPVFNP